MRRSRDIRGFTLVELMVSIAIALLLILGINVVFKTTAQTVGAGNSALEASRDARTVMASLLADLNQCVAPPSLGSVTTADYAPCFIIRSEQTYAFRNFTDREGAADPAPLATGPRPWVDSNLFQYNGFWQGTSNDPFSVPVPYVHFRSHRVDKLGFFARGVFARQTSSDNSSFVSPTTAPEAWIVFGHVMQPSNYLISNPSSTATSPPLWYGPGDLDGTGSKNDNNAVSSDWILGRQAILLNPNIDTSIDPDYLVDMVAGNPNNTNPDLGLTPLSGQVPGAAWKGTPSYLGKSYLNQSRLDMANISMSAYGNPTRAGGLYQIFRPGWTATITDPAKFWYEELIGYRNQASPYLMFDPTASATTGVPKITPYGLALASPSVIRGCAQFIVEYAGNFYTKNQDGSAQDTMGPDPSNPTSTIQIHRPMPDPKGTLDFYQYPLYTSGSSASTTPMIRQTRWYGFPRAINPSTSASPNVLPNYGDVVPLRDVLASLSPQDASPAGTHPFWWLPSTLQSSPTAALPNRTIPSNFADAERFSPNWQTLVDASSASSPTAYPLTLSYTPNRYAFTRPPTNWPFNHTPSLNYWQKMAASVDAPTLPGMAATRYQYTAAWGPDVQFQPFPKLIRITIAMDDHDGRLNQPRLFEFIYQVSP